MDPLFFKNVKYRNKRLFIGQAMQNYNLGWTKKLRLNRSRDPLGLRPLKKLEDYFMPGITTQTQRLRYYSFLTWAWRKIRDKEIKLQKILSMEKVLTLITQYNHQDDNSVPYGTRNTLSASDYLQHQKKRLVDINEYTYFGYGGNNKIGYGNYYYKNPLQILRIVWSDEKGRIRLSEVGETIANIFEAMQGKETFFLSEISKKRLGSLHSFCLCSEMISKEERDIWRMIFFGFTKLKAENQLVLDKQTLNHFQKGELRFFERPEEWHSFGETSLDAFSLNLEQELRTIGRRGTLLIMMKIIETTQPEANELDQIVRDAIYFKQFVSETNDNEVKRISFGKLESLRVLWEVYVHNLYLISVLEEVFGILLEILEKKPMGASLRDVVSSLKFSSIANQIKRLGFNSLDLGNVETQLEQELKEKTSLKKKLNERKLFFNALSSETREEELANLISLLCLLKYRYLSFTESQREVLHYTERDLQSVTPTQIYKYVMRGPIKSFIEKLLKLVADRHRVVASIRYKSGTKCWLVTEEDGLLFHYGKPYEWRAYRESKWRNVVELLCDIGMVEERNRTFKISRIGRAWLKRIE